MWCGTVWTNDGGWEAQWTLDNGVVANLTTGIVSYRYMGASEDRLVSVENITTGNGADTIIGSAGANIIRVGGGENVVQGLAGNDVIVGGSTENYASEARQIMDRLDGGAGNDLIHSGGSLWESIPRRAPPPASPRIGCSAAQETTT